MKYTDYLSRNPVEGAKPEENCDEKYVFNILAKQAELNLKYGRYIGDQSKGNKRITERTKNDSEHEIEHKTDQSQSNGMLDNKIHVNETEQGREQHPDSPILAV